MQSVEDLARLPVMNHGGARPLLEDVAEIRPATSMGLIERYNMQRVISLTANVHGMPLGKAIEPIREALARTGTPPRGVTVALRGQVPVLEETLGRLRIGLLLAVGAIFLLLAAVFQSFRLSLAVILTIPAVFVGVLLTLLATSTTLNVQSFIGTFMAAGIAVANSILLVFVAEVARRDGQPALVAARRAATSRLRAILMTASAMIAGMTPVALGLGTGGEQATPLGRAAIGGLLLATFATLTVLPSLYAIVQQRVKRLSSSMDPTDPQSPYFEG